MALALLLAASPSAGTVDFACHCDPAACAEVRHAVWLLHSFWYEEALRTFRAAEGEDPRCSAAFWGEAMAHDHPLWAPPSEADVRAGLAAARQAVALAAPGTQERGYAEAVLALYDGAPARGPAARAAAYLDRMRALAAAFPDDLDLACFHALALLGARDGDGAKHREAARILAGVLAKAPRHPGALHYLIHADDDAAHAAEALPAARLYAQVAPTVPHALHMPSHIYAALGLWDDAVASNVAAFAATESWVAREKLPAERRDWHSLGFLVYAYLMKGDAGTVRALLALMDEGRSPAQRRATATAHAMRIVNEGDWSASAGYAPAPGDAPPALPPYVHGLGALWLHRPEALAAAIHELGTAKQPDDPEERAWLVLARQELEGGARALAGDRAGALASLADAQRTFEGFPGGPPTGPTPFVPPHELEGDLLRLHFHDANAAAAAYAAALRDAPGRRPSLEGLAATRGPSAR